MLFAQGQSMCLNFSDLPIKGPAVSVIASPIGQNASRAETVRYCMKMH